MSPSTTVWYTKVFCCQSCLGWLTVDEEKETTRACAVAAVETAREAGWKISDHGSAYTCPGCLKKRAEQLAKV